MGIMMKLGYMSNVIRLYYMVLMIVLIKVKRKYYMIKTMK